MKQEIRNIPKWKIEIEESYNETLKRKHFETKHRDRGILNRCHSVFHFKMFLIFRFTCRKIFYFHSWRFDPKAFDLKFYLDSPSTDRIEGIERGSIFWNICGSPNNDGQNVERTVIFQNNWLAKKIAWYKHNWKYVVQKWPVIQWSRMEICHRSGKTSHRSKSRYLRYDICRNESLHYMELNFVAIW